MVQCRADHHRVDAARLYGQMTHAAVAQARPAARQTSRVFGERLDVLAPAPAPEAAGERSSAQLHRCTFTPLATKRFISEMVRARCASTGT